jgi:dihydrodipicolinate synthase/N-acetylneuraminate lyase
MTHPARQALLRRLFPAGVPALWCPLITHYRDDGSLDRERLAAHLRHLAPQVRGFLIPGSTGDGWEMNDAEINDLLDTALAQATQLHFHLLIGVLKTDADAARQSILALRDRFRGRPGIAGFTVCPPKGGGLSQRQLCEGLEKVLELGEAMALYQLPQVTQNEMSAELVADLAGRYPNFILFKDTSGADLVAMSGQDFGGAFLVRGAEGDYAKWLRTGGGPYDGFLLSTANCLAAPLQQLTKLLPNGQREEAARLSERLSGLVREVFGLVTGLPHGNAFANANKAMDHFFAHGPRAARVVPPRLHAGARLPEAVLQAVGQALDRHGFLPQQGYLD